ncbi:hypothetical protein R8Z50_18090 [Longispora sp. K20-0274]|uniref:hypothetical protein n=1 Tax=Longispora sp. K20-0274 TaxID=3088255 RepID=UPI00399B8978
MTGLRWRKVLRDLWSARTRTAMMVVAMAVSVIAVGAVAGARSILDREISRSYGATHPASATLELTSSPGPEALAEVAVQPGSPA